MKDPPVTLPTRSLLPFFLAPALLASTTNQTVMEALDNDSLSQVTGQTGVSLRLGLCAGVARAAWVDDDGNLSLYNLVTDNSCAKVDDCPDGRGGNIPLGATQLGLSLPTFDVEQPTLASGVTAGSDGGRQLAISLPGLTTISDQLIVSGLPAQRTRLRVTSDLYIGDNSIGRIGLCGITDLRGTTKVWGYWGGDVAEGSGKLQEGPVVPAEPAGQWQPIAAGGQDFTLGAGGREHHQVTAR